MTRLISNPLDTALPTLHEILLLNENDEVSYKSGCDWGYVKHKAKEVKITNSTDQVIIETIEKNAVLKMKRNRRIASYFLKHFRDAFAHNRITFNKDTEILTVELNSKKDSSILMEGEISLSALKEITELIKLSKLIKSSKTTN